MWIFCSNCNTHTIRSSFVAGTSALPVYLVLPAGAYRGQSINFIKEDDRRPHQVGLTQKHVHTLNKNYHVQQTCGLKQQKPGV